MATDDVWRLPTGIAGFDKLIEGGIPERNLVLVTGTPGTAKTIFGLQYIANGARDYNEKGVYITFEQSSERLCKQMNRFGYNMKKLMDDDMIRIVEIDAGLGSMKDAFSQLTDRVFVDDLAKFKPKRIVLDSISVATILSRSKGNDREVISEISGMFKYIGATTLLIHERKSSDMGKLEYSTEEFLADGIVHLQLYMTEQLLKRFLTVIKMRETNQSTGVYEFSLGARGITVRS